MVYNWGATRTALQGALCYSSKAVLGMITTKYVVGKTPSMSGTSRPRCSCRNETAAHGGRFAMPIELTCVYCGVLFSVPPSQVRAGRKYCSMVCQAKASSGEHNPNWKGGLTERKCAKCGNSIKIKPSHIKETGNFCSQACAREWRRANAIGYDPTKRVVKHCQVCGKELRIKQSHVEIEGTYCSTACMAEGYRSVLKGRANPNYRHGMAYTNEYSRAANAIQRAARVDAVGTYSAKDIVSMMHHQRCECAACGKSLRDGYEVDHRIPLSRGGSNYVGNLQLLCKHCNRTKMDRFVIELRYRK
jgi:5-methylcytosine-specific restriction endonuclease McrA